MKIKTIYIGIILMICSAGLTAIGQALWKLATEGLLSWQLYVGAICYGMGAIIMIVAFKFGSLSVLHPLLSLGYVFALVIGVQFLGEEVTTTKIIGNLFIIGGAALIGLSGSTEKVKK